MRRWLAGMLVSDLEAFVVPGLEIADALGLDRLVMLAAGATHIEQVLWVPVADL